MEQHNAASDPRTAANSAEVCAMQELVYNGRPIEWGQWWNRTDLNPMEAAKLLFCIDPIRWDGEQYAQGKIEYELLLKIRKAAALMGNVKPFWSLSDLVEHYGTEDTPFAMHLTVQTARDEKSAAFGEKVRRESAAQAPPENGLTAQSNSQHVPSKARVTPWTLKKPDRYQGYRKPLYDVLKEAHDNGRLCPTARDVLDAFKKWKPPEIVEVTYDGLKYYDGEGNSKAIGLKAVAQAINRLAQVETNSTN